MQRYGNRIPFSINDHPEGLIADGSEFQCISGPAVSEKKPEGPGGIAETANRSMQKTDRSKGDRFFTLRIQCNTLYKFRLGGGTPCKRDDE